MFDCSYKSYVIYYDWYLILSPIADLEVWAYIHFFLLILIEIVPPKRGKTLPNFNSYLDCAQESLPTNTEFLPL